MIRLFIISFFLGCAQHIGAQTDTLRIYFQTDVAAPDSSQLRRIREILPALNSEKLIEIVGYADERGDVPYNKSLSFRRAQSVAAFLESAGIDKKCLKMVEGRGEVARPDGNLLSYRLDRRVDIVYSGVNKYPDTTGMPALPGKLMSINEGQTIVLENVYFFLGSAELLLSSLPTLETLLRTMKENPGLVIKLEGHICCVPKGEEAIYRPGALRLSWARANRIKQYLMDGGIDENRMIAVGFGMDRPLIPDEKTEEDRRLNRRVEARIIKK